MRFRKESKHEDHSPLGTVRPIKSWPAGWVGLPAGETSFVTDWSSVSYLHQNGGNGYRQPCDPGFGDAGRGLDAIASVPASPDPVAGAHQRGAPTARPLRGEALGQLASLAIDHRPDLLPAVFDLSCRWFETDSPSMPLNARCPALRADLTDLTFQMLWDDLGGES